MAIWDARKKKVPGELFDHLGGTGYDARRDPNPRCPECFGNGIERMYAKDTRRLSAAARVLYAGVKTTKDGLEVKMHDQAGALLQVGRHLGMFTDKHELKIPKGIGVFALPVPVKTARNRRRNRNATRRRNQIPAPQRTPPQGVQLQEIRAMTNELGRQDSNLQLPD